MQAPREGAQHDEEHRVLLDTSQSGFTSDTYTYCRWGKEGESKAGIHDQIAKSIITQVLCDRHVVTLWVTLLPKLLPNL